MNSLQGHGDISHTASSLIFVLFVFGKWLNLDYDYLVVLTGNDLAEALKSVSSIGIDLQRLFVATPNDIEDLYLTGWGLSTNIKFFVVHCS
ncbi:hypothetical protein GOP47_0019734 [Adiantum capillus-veneris]|uniref:Uncharacterized protein n=1 Tax=Adiantum capillus-veneris TaxID=13818 RepID=A0A9D4UD35_ADICA|nr:hypothetical protein GOP47_0019734 [Adiantum capillus-veneris]